MKIYVGGNEFYIRGMLYRPEPLAISTIDHEGSGGSGACSPRETVLGSGVSACAGFDYFSEHWSDLWDRDLPRMKDIGVNTVRIRGMCVCVCVHDDGPIHMEPALITNQHRCSDGRFG